MEAKEHLLEFIASVADPEEQKVINDLFATNSAFESAEQCDEHQEGLHGKKLYVCGNIGCAETTETSAKFKVWCNFIHSAIIPKN